MATLSAGRASGPWPGADPGPALKGPGSGQNFDRLARPAWGQGPGHRSWPDPGRPGVGPALCVISACGPHSEVSTC